MSTFVKWKYRQSLQAQQSNAITKSIESLTAAVRKQAHCTNHLQVPNLSSLTHHRAVCSTETQRIALQD